jgi:hypothetical protein
VLVYSHICAPWDLLQRGRPNNLPLLEVLPLVPIPLRRPAIKRLYLAGAVDSFYHKHWRVPMPDSKQRSVRKRLLGQITTIPLVGHLSQYMYQIHIVHTYRRFGY